MQNPLIEKLSSKTFKAPSSASGVQPVVEVQLQKDPGTGGITTDPYLRVNVVQRTMPSESSSGDMHGSPMDNVYAIGDCAVIPGEHLSYIHTALGHKDRLISTPYTPSALYTF